MQFMGLISDAIELQYTDIDGIWLNHYYSCLIE